VASASRSFNVGNEMIDSRGRRWTRDDFATRDGSGSGDTVIAATSCVR
jgi:hypothetical protein